MPDTLDVVIVRFGLSIAQLIDVVRPSRHPSPPWDQHPLGIPGPPPPPSPLLPPLLIGASLLTASAACSPLSALEPLFRGTAGQQWGSRPLLDPLDRSLEVPGGLGKGGSVPGRGGQAGLAGCLGGSSG